LYCATSASRFQALTGLFHSFNASRFVFIRFNILRMPRATAALRDGATTKLYPTI
jgi:hypothetical protein